MNGKALRQLRVELGCKTQKDLEKKFERNNIGRSQQAISAAENKDKPSEKFLMNYKKDLLAVFRDIDDKNLIEEFFRSPVLDEKEPGITRERIRQAVFQTPAFDPVVAENIDLEALPWTVDFRTPVLIDRLSALARAAGLVPMRLSALDYGLVLLEGTKPKLCYDDVLFPHPKTFDIKAETIILLASPFKHPVVGEALKPLQYELKKTAGVEIAFVPEEKAEKRPFFFFGYPTRFNDLKLNGKTYRSRRYLNDEGQLCYEDFGAVIHCPISKLVKSEKSPFGKHAINARRIYIAAGAHRLATGAAVRLLEDRCLRSLLFGDKDCQFRGTGLLAFRIVIRCGPFLEVDAFEKIGPW